MEITNKKLLDCISAAQFAVAELNLYLDTHPFDKEALDKLTAAKSRLKSYVKQYEEEYGPLTVLGEFGNDGFTWINNPWPWEKEAN